MASYRHVLAFFAVLASWFAVATPETAAQPKPPAGFLAEYGIKYVTNGDKAQELDIYFPQKRAEKPQPLLIWIHGGGWTAGSKNDVPLMNQLPRGYVVASIEYRFSQKALFPAQIQDCQAAIRWLRANAKNYNIDPDHVGVAGASAGGHLAALVGTAGGKKAFPAIGGNEEQSHRVQAVCDIFGPTNFWTVVTQANEDKNVKNIFKWNQGDPYSKLIGAKLGEDKEKCEAVSPVHYVSKESPPFLILHGDKDALVPFAQSVELKDRLANVGVKVVLQRLPGAGHGGPAFALPAVTRLTETFFGRYLKGVDANIEPLPDDQVTVKPNPK